MRTPRANRRFCYAFRFLLCVVPLLAGCALIPPKSATAPEAGLLAAFVVLGENGTAWARTIQPASPAPPSSAVCPVITADGAMLTMRVRAAAATPARRPTARDGAQSKPAAFPVQTCELALPRGTRRATIGDLELRLPKAEVLRIVLIGDTGCRMKKSDKEWQACGDEEAWPFRKVADAAAAMSPDLVIHVGDFHYRESQCPPDIAGCHGSPWGYGWDTWQADLFDPAAKLLAAAPWVVARGNHEECRRAGQGWFRFLDTRPFEEARSCNDAKNDPLANFSPPYAVPIARDLQFIVFDSAIAGHAPLDMANPRDAHAFSQYRRQFAQVDQLASKAGVNTLFINHHLILAYAQEEKIGIVGGSPPQLAAMKSLHAEAYYPASVQLALHGHVHLFEAINFASNHPAAIVAGMGGTNADANLPDPFPLNIGPAEGVTLESITHSNQFGFVMMDKRDGGWQISAHDHHGVKKVTCILTGSKLRCDKTGLLK
ncbi:MAG: metallophosphoesterase [Betaproteobacteria bacterium]